MKIFLDANICLDLLDSKRPTSKDSIEWYMNNKDSDAVEFYFSSDFITTFYYILTEKRKYNPVEVINTIDALSLESALRLDCDVFITNDKALLDLKEFKGVDIVSPKNYKKE